MALNNMSHGLLMIDAKGRVTVVNRQLLNLFRLGADDVQSGASLRAVARTLMRRKIVAQDQIERVWKTLARAAAGIDVVAPFETRDDRAIEITIHRMTGEGEGAVVVVQDVTERRNAARAIDRMARVDSVTDLPNRRRFEEELVETLRGRGEEVESANVLFLDLDDFKQVNDSLGHARGDKLLTAVARRLQGIVRDTDIVARWGGDEFAILQRPVADPGAGRRARRADPARNPSAGVHRRL